MLKCSRQADHSSCGIRTQRIYGCVLTVFNESVICLARVMLFLCKSAPVITRAKEVERKQNLQLVAAKWKGEKHHVV